MSGNIQGQVVAISNDGDAVTDISVDQLKDAPADESVSIQCEGHITNRIFPTDHEQPSMTFLAKQGVSGCLELSLVGDSVQTFLGIQPGSLVTVTW